MPPLCDVQMIVAVKIRVSKMLRTVFLLTFPSDVSPGWFETVFSPDLKHACVNFIPSRSEQYYGLIPPPRRYMKLLKRAQYLPCVRMIKPKKKPLQ